MTWTIPNYTWKNKSQQKQQCSIFISTSCPLGVFFNIPWTKELWHGFTKWRPRDPASHLNSYELGNTYSFPTTIPQPFLPYLLHLHRSGTLFFETPPEDYHQFFSLSPWRKWVITSRTMMIPFSCFKCTLFFYFSWAAGSLMVLFSFGSVGGLGRFTLWTPFHHVTQ